MIALDTSVFMDLLSGNHEFVLTAEKILHEAKSSGYVISVAALSEIIYHVSRRKNPQIASEAIMFIQSIPGIVIRDVSVDLAILAGLLRHKYYKNREREISYLDCIHLATAIQEGATRFITTDSDFQGVDEIKVEIYR